MNSIRTINTAYIRPSRTIETILVSDKSIEKVVFVYNYEGNSFRVFLDRINLIDFFKSEDISEDIHFDNETELDLFLLNMLLK